MTPGSHWARLVEARAEALLAARAAPPALVLGGPDGFPCAVAGATVTAPPADGALPFADAAFASVIDATRPESARPVAVAELGRVCRPEGAVVTVARGRELGARVGALAAAGCVVDATTPFDLLSSPWAAALDASVGEELDAHLEAPGVQAAVALLEAELVALLPPAAVGRVVVVGRRSATRAAAVLDPPSIRARLDDPTLRSTLLGFAQDDAVVRWAAFLDAELLSPAGVAFDLARYLEEIGGVAPAELRPGLWRWPGFETYRFLQAVSHRMAARTAAALAADTALPPEWRGLPATLAYDFVDPRNGLRDRCLAVEAPWIG